MSRPPSVPDRRPWWWPHPLLALLTLQYCAVPSCLVFPWWITLAPLGAAALLGLFLALRSRHGLFGLLGRYEVVWLARRGRVTLLRIAYGLLLLAGLGAAYADRFWQADGLAGLFGTTAAHLDRNAMAALAMTCFRALVAAQTGAVLVLTPVYLTAAVAEEKEGRTLELLLSTPLEDHEIILGKLLGRLLHVGGILLTGLPVLCLLPWWGGVDVRFVLAALVTTALSLLSVGSIGIFCSVSCRTRLGALALAYVIGTVGFAYLVGFAMATPLDFVNESARVVSNPSVSLFGQFALGGATGDAMLLSMMGLYAFIHSLIAVIFLSLATRNLRRTCLPARPPVVEGPPVLVPRPKTAAQKALAGLFGPGGAADTSGLLLVSPVGDRPLLWKEMHFGVPPELLQWRGVLFILVIVESALTALFTLGILAVLASGGYWTEVASTYDALHGVIRILVVVNLGALGLTVAFRAAASISRERAERTWDSLLTLPLERRDILRAKGLGAVLWGRALVVPLGVVLLAGMLATLLSPLAVLLLAAAAVIHVAFFAALGLWLSLVCRSTLRACLWLGVVLLVLIGGSWLALAFSQTLAGGRGAASWAENLVGAGLNPAGAWWALGFSWGELTDGVAAAEPAFRMKLAAALVGLAGYAGAAWVVWADAGRRLR